ncbi:MAG: hypothetical protein ACHQIG_07625 [Acidimicrobiia bacterium]
MAISTLTAGDHFEDRVLLARALDAGYRLVQRELATGLLVWEWEHGDAPRPQFASRRVALHWIGEVLHRGRGVAYVSNAGSAYRVTT